MKVVLDFSEIGNPYDFGNAVTDKELFAGREKELKEIRYYLEQAKNSRRPLSLAILGPRASGKTSLLNMAETEAKQRHLCVARVNLDEDDGKNSMIFFRKIFDSILSSACELGAFGGVNEKTYETYLDIVSGYELPKDNTFCPFLFPRQYAFAMRNNNPNAQLQDQNYERDLKTLHNELKIPIIIIFDEGNVLTNNRVHLQKLRNLFMNQVGYMLIMAGTPELFPAIDDIFSPIIRQFKKINIEGFIDFKDTRDCVIKPLQRLSLDLSEIVDFFSLIELHEISAGRPYEIQLLCHFMFKKIQDGETQKMQLNRSVFEDVVEELESTQSLSRREMVSFIKNLDSKHLQALHNILAIDEELTFEKIWQIEYVFYGTNRYTKDSLDKVIKELILKNILTLGSQDKILFMGDDFDRIYCMYFAKEQGLESNFGRLPLLSLLYFQFSKILNDLFGLNTATRFGFGGEYNKNSYESYKLIKTDFDKFIQECDPREFVSIYEVIGENKIGNIFMFLVKINLQWISFQSIYYCNTEKSELDVKTLSPIASRFNDVGWELEYDFTNLSFISFEQLKQKIILLENEALIEAVALYHFNQMVELYSQNAPFEDILFHAKLGHYYKPDLQYNNLGYVYLIGNNLFEAENMFRNAIENAEDTLEKSLPLYNLGIVKAKEKDYRISLDYIQQSISLSLSIPDEDRQCMTLFEINLVEDEIVISENKDNPDLLETASKSKENLELFISKQ